MPANHLGRSELVLAEPIGEGYAAACLARFGEGPIAVALDGTMTAGRAARTNPVGGGPATYVRHRPGNRPDAHLPACGMTSDETHGAVVEAWRRAAIRRLRQDAGWLTLAGLEWLRPGVNRVGSDPDAEVVLPAGPPHGGHRDPDR